MADFIGWISDVFNMEFTIGLVTVSLGYLAVAGLVVSYGLKALRKIGR